MNVSVIVPVYNGEATIDSCLESLLQQARAAGDVEIIVVDDGSTDGTISVLSRYESVRVIRQPVNAGPAAARNRGVAEASGDIVLFTDADCTPSEDWIMEMTVPFHADARVVGAKGIYKTKQPELTARFVQLEYEDKYDKMRRDDAIDFIDTYSAAYRRSVFLEMGGYDCRFPVACAEDVELSFRLAQKGYRMVFVERARVYHLHPFRWIDYLKKKYKFAYWRAVAIRMHPSKAFRDSHTPLTQKLQIILVPLSACTIVGAFWSPALLWPGLIGWGAVALTMVPFLSKSIRRDWFPALCSPFFIIPRAVVQCAAVLSSVTEPFLMKGHLPRKVGAR
jgi:glycosyltransferase involved in cell wall biosynthesis